MDKNIELTEEQKLQAKELVEDQMTKLGEVFSQCWESDEFKQAFIEDPKAIFDEYGIGYDKNKNYKVIETPEKTMIHVLPYKGIKESIKAFNDLLLKHVEDVEDGDAKQVLLPDWSWQLYQNTEDTYYVPIPLCPENLTPEELELVNGGCLIFVLIFAFQTEAVATTTTVAAEVEALIVAVVSAIGAIDAVAAAFVLLAIAEAIAAVTSVVANVEYMYTLTEQTGAFVFVHNAAIDEAPKQSASAASQLSGAVDPRRRGR